MKTPGREAKKETDVDDVAISDTELITKVIEALGGSSNIVHVNACYSRLRVDVHEVSKVDKDAFTNLQASGVSILGKNIQVIYGMKANNAIPTGITIHQFERFVRTLKNR